MVSSTFKSISKPSLSGQPTRKYPLILSNKYIFVTFIIGIIGIVQAEPNQTPGQDSSKIEYKWGFMDKTGIEGFKKTDYEIGANISISPGPTKESLEKGVDFNNSIYTYSYSEGLYAGFTLEGSVIHADHSANRSFYGTEISNEDILNTQEPDNKLVLKLIIAIEQISK